MSREMQIEVITYEKDRLNYFTDLMKKAQKRYRRLFKKFKDAPILSAESEMLSDAGRETQFHGDVVEMLEKGYCKQSEWISVDERMPENYEHCLLFLDNETMEIGWYHEVANKFVVGGLVTLNSVTHWMPLPEAPKGGE